MVVHRWNQNTMQGVVHCIISTYRHESIPAWIGMSDETITFSRLTCIISIYYQVNSE